MLNEREAVLVDDAVVEFKPGAASVVAALKSRFGCRCIQGLWIVGVATRPRTAPLSTSDVGCKSQFEPFERASKSPATVPTSRRAYVAMRGILISHIAVCEGIW